MDPRHEAWRDPSNESMLVHDAFHHHPRDGGTNEQEWTTLGVEVWQKGLERDGPIFPDHVKQVACTVMQVLLEPSAHAQLSSFKPALLSAPLAETTYDATWIDAIREGVTEVLEYEPAGIDDMEDYIKQAAGWAWHGFIRAQALYPDPDMVRAQMRGLERAARICAGLVQQGVLRQWAASWDQEHGVRASFQGQDGSWQAVLPGGVRV